MRQAAKKSEQGPFSIQTLWYTHARMHGRTHENSKSAWLAIQLLNINYDNWHYILAGTRCY